MIVKTQVLHDIAALDEGVLTYSQLRVIKTGESTEFSVTITDIGKKPRSAIPATDTSNLIGRVVYPEDVPTGGYVGVQLSSCVNLTCQSQSTADRWVVEIGKPIWWYWSITASKPGLAMLSLKVDTFKGTSTQVLEEETPRPIDVNVLASKTYTSPPVSSPAAVPPGGGGGSPPNWLWVLISLLVAIITGGSVIYAAIIGVKQRKENTPNRS